LEKLKSQTLRKNFTKIGILFDNFVDGNRAKKILVDEQNEEKHYFSMFSFWGSVLRNFW